MSMGVLVEFPANLYQISPRTHNRFVREALRAEAERHGQTRFAQHFERSAHTRYGYAERKASYVRYKQRKYRTGGMDLVKTGQSRAHMVQAANQKITIGGSAEGGKRPIVLRLSTKFPWQQARNGTGVPNEPSRLEKVAERAARRLARHGSARIGAEQMVREMQTVTSDEARDITAGVRQRYFAALAASPRLRKRVQISGAMNHGAL